MAGERHTRVGTVACTVAGGRAVVELLAHLADDGRELAWPLAVVAESPDRRSVVFRGYFSRRAVTGSATCSLPSSSPGLPIPVMSWAATRAALAAGNAEGPTRGERGREVDRPTR